MTANTKIEWADHTQNWWVGCKPISPGCTNCYAEVWAKRAGRDFSVRTRTTDHGMACVVETAEECIETCSGVTHWLDGLEPPGEGKAHEAR